MRKKSILARVVALPLLHKILATAIALSVIAIGLDQVRRVPQRYASSAVLSYEQVASEQPAKAVAESILSDGALKTLAAQLRLFPGDSPDRQMSRIRAHLRLMEFLNSSRLRVTWQGDDPAQAVTVTNAVTELLGSWVPPESRKQPVPDPASPSPPVAASAAKVAIPDPAKPQVEDRQGGGSGLRARRAELVEEEGRLQSLIDKTDHRMTALDGEQRRLGENVQLAKAGKQGQLDAQVAAAKKNLETLRARYTDAYPDVQTAQEHLAALQAEQAASSAARSQPVSDQARIDVIATEMGELRRERGRLLQRVQDDAALEKSLRDQEVRQRSAAVTPQPRAANAPQTASTAASGGVKPPAAVAMGAQAATKAEAIKAINTRRSPFGVLERAEVALPVEGAQSTLRWLGVGAGFLSGLLYMAGALWWFRTVQSVATLERIMPGDVLYVGAISRMSR